MLTNKFFQLLRLSLHDIPVVPLSCAVAPVSVAVDTITPSLPSTNSVVNPATDDIEEEVVSR